MPIDAEFLSILRCPKTRKPLRTATAEELAEVRRLVALGKATTRGGERVEEAPEEGLVPEGERFVYPIRDDIPVLLVQEAILLDTGAPAEEEDR